MIDKYSKNPVISPRQDVWWEAKSVFNPGVAGDEGIVHLLYRALGVDRVSRFGYACSHDGLSFGGFRELPVFETGERDPYGRLGCEDPRITRIDGRYLITYVLASLYPCDHQPAVFSTSRAPWRIRVALMETEDFKSFNDFGIILPDMDTKDAVLFPEKISGNYVLLHRVWPDIWISYSRDLREWSGHKAIVNSGETPWEERKIGAGAPPIKTPLGWLLFYHGVDRNFVYRSGIILLDLANPERVLYRSESPVLEPEETYEKSGFVDNVVFVTGAAEVGSEYYLYYGAADTSIGVATVNKDALLSQIERDIRAGAKA